MDAAQFRKTENISIKKKNKKKSEWEQPGTIKCLNCGPLAGISVPCGELASDAFQTKPVEYLSDTDINAISNVANPDYSSERKTEKKLSDEIKNGNCDANLCDSIQIRQFISVAMFIQATITMVVILGEG